MACCGLCRSKIKIPIKMKKNITTEKINDIDIWIENIEGPYDPINLPSKPPKKPIIVTNKEEIAEVYMNNSCLSINPMYIRN
jgi:hypothetical protein